MTTVETIDLKPKAFWQTNFRPTVSDRYFGLTLLVVYGLLWLALGNKMDPYEVAIFSASFPAIVGLGWWWNPLRFLTLAVVASTGLAWWNYQSQGQGVLSMADTRFVLKYFLSSQSSMMWMALSLLTSTVLYWLYLCFQSKSKVGLWATRAAWFGVFMALSGTMVRWYESYLIGTDIGHIPVSNLYEVFVLFCWLTTLMYLYMEDRFENRRMGPWVMLVVSAAVWFLLWYATSRNAHTIQPLIPALQSWWMKIHVPANFVGYGGFSIAAMLAIARLIISYTRSKVEHIGGVSNRLPSIEILDEVMYRSIAVGFAFFTVATVLGALWAADAWGGYWSWDPKETWALIVWLNYAAWLHLRMIKKLSEEIAAWWALIGLLMTTFAFIGVNMFLSGLHSYGNL